MKKTLTLILPTFILIVGLTLQSEAAGGMRYSEITYRITDVTDTTFDVEFTIESYWDVGYPGFPAVILPTSFLLLPDFHYGDGSSAFLFMDVDKVFVDPFTGDDVVRGTSTLFHTYDGGPGTTFDAYMIAQKRTPMLTDGNNLSFYNLKSKVINKGRGYDSPALTYSPIKQVEQGASGLTENFVDRVDESQINGTPDFFIPTSNESGLNPVKPSFLTSLSMPGVATLNVPAAQPLGFYAAQIRVEDDITGSGIIDFIYQVVVPCTGDKSAFVDDAGADSPNNGDVIMASVNVPFSFTMYAKTLNGGSSIAKITDPIIQALPGATFTSGTDGFGNTTLTFNWTPDRIITKALEFTAYNDDCTVGETRVITIDVDKCFEFTGSNPYVHILYNQPPNMSVDYPGVPQNVFYPGYTISADLCLVIPGFVGFDVDYEWDIDGNIYTTECINLTSVPTSAALAAVWINEDNCVINLSAPVPTGVLPNSCTAFISVNNCSTFGDANTFYRGYTTGLQLTASASGSGPYTYLWSTGDTTESISVVPTATTSYAVTVTDGSGCSASETQTITYVDLRCGGNCDPIVSTGGSSDDDDDGGSCSDDDDDGGCSDDDDDGSSKRGRRGRGSSDDDDDGGNCGNNNKVVICHIPPGNPGNAHNITVSQNAVAAHLAHGDILGGCPPDPCEAISYKKKCKVTLCKISGSGCNNGPRTICTKSKNVEWLLNTGNYVLGACSNKTEAVGLFNSLTVSPNPSNDGKFLMSYELLEDTELHMQVVDYMGRVVFESNSFAEGGLYDDVLDLGNVPAGLYILNVQAFGDVFTEKLQILK